MYPISFAQSIIGYHNGSGVKKQEGPENPIHIDHEVIPGIVITNTENPQALNDQAVGKRKKNEG